MIDRSGLAGHARPSLGPVALTIAGSDSGGGAGIQADLAVFRALGVHGTSAIGVLTAQDARSVAAVHAVDPGFLGRQIDVVLGGFEIGAVKVGMLWSIPAVEVVADRLSGRVENVVVDPVLESGAGEPLLEDGAIEVFVRALLPLARVVTPNWPEALRLAGPGCGSEPGPVAARLLELGPRAVLLKGGHRPVEPVTDFLVTAQGEARRWSRRRVGPGRFHGTGCALSSAVAAYLARGLDLETAVDGAIRYVEAAMASAIDAGAGVFFLRHPPGGPGGYDVGPRSGPDRMPPVP